MENEQREISNTNEITTFMHCGLCMKELPSNDSPRDYASLEVGYTEMGIQIWCKRHECNVLHMDFAGQKFYANTTRNEDKEEKMVIN